MITSLRLRNFKNFADETLRVGPFTVIVGANASGKSNIRDAFRFLHGIGRGYTLAEIIGGKFETDTSRLQNHGCPDPRSMAILARDVRDVDRYPHQRSQTPGHRRSGGTETFGTGRRQWRHPSCRK